MNLNIKEEYEKIFESKLAHLNSKNLVKCDIHCYNFETKDKSSIVSKILRAPFSYLKTEDLTKAQLLNGATPLTITNLNNATLSLKNFLPAAEFECQFFKENFVFNVLVYGLNKADEIQLVKLKSNILKFLQYVKNNNLVAVLASPFLQNKKQTFDFSVFERFLIIFKNFEVSTSIKDSKVDMIYIKWLESFNIEKLKFLENKYNLNSAEFMSSPEEKVFYAGSADNSGVFCGDYGIVFEKTSSSEPLSSQFLKAMQTGRVAPYGKFIEKNNCSTIFTNYFLSMVLNLKDPGLFRILFYKTNLKHKIAAIIIFNFIAELHRHKFTINYIKSMSNSFKGEKIFFKIQSLFFNKNQLLEKQLNQIAAVKKINAPNKNDIMQKSMENIFYILQNEVKEKIDLIIKKNKSLTSLTPDEILNFIDIPAYIREINKNSSLPQRLGLGNYLDKIPFEALLYLIILSSYIIGDYSYNENKYIIEEFDKEVNGTKKEERILWLTDSFEEKNGVSECIKSYLSEIRKNNLNIDILVCSDKLQNEKNLYVVPPVMKFALPFYKGNFLKIPDLIKVNKIFDNNNYTRLITSTEFAMGYTAVLLKWTKKVPLYFFMHTDWIEYCKQSLNLSYKNFLKIKSFVKRFYSIFEKVFVLNKDHLNWMTGFKMKINKNKVFLTYHWIDNKTFFPDLSYKQNKTLNFLFVGRLSEEKGIYVVAEFYKTFLKQNLPVHFTIAGLGPEEEKLKELMPTATFLGWVDHKNLADIYRKADLLILPNKFDTFGMVILEALSCGCPVAAYSAKGPKEILTSSNAGLLSSNKKEMENQIIDLISNPNKLFQFRENAINHSKKFDKNIIFNKFIDDLMV